MRVLRGRQRPKQIGTRITLGTTGRHGVAKDLAAVLVGAMCRVQRTAAFHPTKHRQHLRWRHFSDRTPPDPRKHIFLQTLNDLVCV